VRAKGCEGRRGRRGTKKGASFERQAKLAPMRASGFRRRKVARKNVKDRAKLPPSARTRTVEW
jgi:hypothetical protein